MEGQLQAKCVETAHGKIYYFSHITVTEKPTILFLHGLSSNHTTWEYMMNKFAENGMNVISPDLRGHGHSDKTRKRKLYALNSAKKDIDAIMRQENLSSVHVIGYSWGGYIAIDLAASFPDKVRSLVLISTNHRNYFSYGHFPFVAPFAKALLVFLGYLLKWQKRKKYHYFNQSQARGYWQSTFTGLATMPISINFWMLSEAVSVDFKDSVSDISCPTLIISGKNDQFISEKEISDMAEKIKKSEVLTLDGLNHFLAGHHQDILAEHIGEFIGKHV